MFPYMDKKWLERQIENADEDKSDLVFFELWGNISFNCIDNIQACYRQPEDLNN